MEDGSSSTTVDPFRPKLEEEGKARYMYSGTVAANILRCSSSSADNFVTEVK